MWNSRAQLLNGPEKLESDLIRCARGVNREKNSSRDMDFCALPVDGANLLHDQNRIDVDNESNEVEKVNITSRASLVGARLGLSHRNQCCLLLSEVGTHIA